MPTKFCGRASGWPMSSIRRLEVLDAITVDGETTATAKIAASTYTDTSSLVAAIQTAIDQTTLKGRVTASSDSSGIITLNSTHGGRLSSLDVSGNAAMQLKLAPTATAIMSVSGSNAMMIVTGHYAPGVVTGIALANAFLTILGIRLGFFTLVVAHATFCIVTVFNNAIARLRRMGNSLEEASMDLGANSWTTFRLVTLPMLRSALLAGGLLAFALSFDEIIVTTFTAGAGVQTLPIWIYPTLFRPNQAPVVNVVKAA